MPGQQPLKALDATGTTYTSLHWLNAAAGLQMIPRAAPSTFRAFRPLSRQQFQLHQLRTMSSFKLSKDIFNPQLYKSIQDIWFEGHPLGTKGLDQDVAKRWFMLQGQDRDAFDSVCRSNFVRALEAIGPEHMSNPSPEPFLEEIQDALQKNPRDQGSQAAWTALSIILLLDQMSRNVYRSNEGLRKVYTHYDKIAFSLVNILLSADSPVIRPDLHPQWHNSIVHRHWFYMPLMHSEDLGSHKKALDIMEQMGEDLKKLGVSDEEMAFAAQEVKFEKEHMEIIEKFGRYPHRNVALGREMTYEETSFMKEGGATFGVSQEDR